MLGEQRGDAGAIGEIEPDELEILGAGKLPQPRLLQLRIVIGVKIVEADHPRPFSNRRRAT